jgi:hypothetical protein
MKFTTSLKLKLIYVFRINDLNHFGCLKVGEATSDNEEIWGLEPNSTALNRAAKKRINQYTQTAGISYDLLYTESTIYVNNKTIKSFNDYEVRNVLFRSGIEKKVFDIANKANEWVITDLETVKKAIKAVKEGKQSLNANEISTAQNPIVFRPEQQDAINKTKKQFKKSKEMLWFAKMRFGKTLSALQVIKDHYFKRTLILTHRPVVDAGWFEDFGKIFYDKPNYNYGSKNNGDEFITLEKRSKKEDVNYIYFASMQDLRGSELVGGNFDKNDEIFDASWDFIIVDEAHEGTQTDLGKNVLNGLKKNSPKILHLSGTPFNLIDDYKEEEIYTWDYVMEQKAKQDWDDIHFGDPNPYTSLPKMNIFTYDLGNLINDFADEDVAFNFKEFFRVDETDDFIHKKDVEKFLNLICKGDSESNYPFATQEYRDNFRHSLWMVPGVKEARALSTLLNSHPVFSHFNIVNVAGDGDVDEDNEEALKKVENAITDKPQDTYTITLSCGRLTTGVSVKAWTAVFMLSGSHNTSASAYMQTIFRVQTPATINGKVKEECFVFDFAPDRTLKVIAEAAKMSAKAGKTLDQDRLIMGEFLNFCPIISADGAQMKEYNVNTMLEQLKKVYIERVVSNGFEDSHLYNNDQLMKLESIELEEFNGLKKIIGSTKAIAKTSEIDINKQGFTEEEYQKLESAKKKKKEDLSEEDKKLLDERAEKKKNRDSAVSILRGISIRMPLLIYGADIKDEEKELTINNFTDLIDDQSWTEFMPKGVTKATFKKFKKYYEPDVFRAAGKRIRALSRATDSLTIDDRIERITAIFGKFKNPDKETVLTPWRVVNMHMGNCLGGYVFFDDKFENTITSPRYINQEKITDEVYKTDSCILEINSKSGLYPLFIAYSVYRNEIKTAYPKKEYDELTVSEQHKIWDKVVATNVFVLCKTPMAKSITKRTLVGFRDVAVNTRYFEDLVHQTTDRPEKFIEKIRKAKTYGKANNNNDMKFNAIVGNPPYQLSAKSGNRSKPIYNKFVDISKQINPDFLSLIMPSRWMAGGLGLSEFRNTMLQDKRLNKLIDHPVSNEVFPGVEVKGGICYFLWLKGHNDKCKIITKRGSEVYGPIERNLDEFDILVRDSRAIEILNKVLSFEETSITTILSVDKEFGWTSNFNNFSETKIKDYIPLHYIRKTKRNIGWIKRDEITKSENLIDSYKVLIPKAGSDGGKKIPDSVLGKPLVVGNPSVCTQSFLFFYIDSKNQANNIEQYLKTKFFRFLVSLRKMTQDATKSSYQWVPIQNFNEDSDINWKESIENIDIQLLKKYDFTQEDEAFVEKMIKTMK